MKLMIAFCIAMIAGVACSSSPDVTSDDVQSQFEQGVKVAPSGVDLASFNDAVDALGVHPNICVTGPGGPSMCCSQNGNTVCCFSFKTGQTRCFEVGGPPRQEP